MLLFDRQTLTDIVLEVYVKHKHNNCWVYRYSLSLIFRIVFSFVSYSVVCIVVVVRILPRNFKFYWWILVLIIAFTQQTKGEEKKLVRWMGVTRSMMTASAPHCGSNVIVMSGAGSKRGSLSARCSGLTRLVYSATTHNTSRHL